MPRPPTFTDDQLREAVALSSTLNELCCRLGVAAGGRTFMQLRERFDHVGIDASHMRLGPRGECGPGKRRRWTEDELREVVADSKSIADVLRRLGYTPSGGTHRWIKMKLSVLGIDTGHFTGQSWRGGLSSPPGGIRARPLDQVLVAGSVYHGRLRQRLIEAGSRPAHCETCGLSEWRGASLPLALDHINGDPTDNRLENLRILCPNCHAQTETWCGRNRKRAKPAYSNSKRA